MNVQASAPPLVLVDGSGYIFRAFFALPPMTRPDGTPINAVFGFSNMVMKLLQDRPNDDIVVVFDASGVSFRNDLYADYKAQRDEAPPELVPQFPLMREAARAFGLPVVELEGFEADDLIASFAKAARAEGREVVIVSSDKDLMQLLGPGVAMWDPMKNKDIGVSEVAEKWGVGPERLRDVLALAGDSSDNVPGVPGIGPKTAATLINEFGSLEALLGGTATIKQPKRRESLETYAEQARLSYVLVGLRDDVPLPVAISETARAPIDADKLLAFCRENGLRSLAARVEQQGNLEPARAPVAEGAVLPRFTPVADLARLEAIAARALEVGRLAIDCETTSLDIGRAELCGICLAVEAGEGFYVPVGHLDEFGQRCAGQLERDAALACLGPVLADRSVLKLGHNIKYDLAVLAKYDVAVAPIDDSMLISYVLDGASHGHGMDELAKRHLGYDTIPFAAVCGRGTAQITFDRAPLDKATDYAAEDAEVTLRLWETLRPRLVEQRLCTVYETLERPLAALLAEMERAGIAVDAARLRELSAVFTARMAELEEQAYRLAGRTFALGSPKQLGEVLFDELGLLGSGRRTKTGAHATGAEILEELAAQGHELPRVVLDWRQLQKLTRTYTDALVEEIVPETGRVHTSYMMAATSTGRLSSSDPNLQNIPIRSEEGRKIRAAFVPAPGCLLVSADYSQIELRVLAHMADIKALKEAFAKDVDIHATTAAQMFKQPLDQIGPALRRSAKTINYGIIYGIGAFGLAQRLGIPHAEAKAYIEAYFEQYPGIRDYMERAKVEAREHGYVTTLFGRRCFVPDIANRLPTRRNYAERQAINAPIQGSAADIMKRAMIRVGRALARSGAGARMLLQVHDELVFEVPVGELEATVTLVRGEMAGAAALSVPLVVDVGSGATWDEAH